MTGKASGSMVLTSQETEFTGSLVLMVLMVLMVLGIADSVCMDDLYGDSSEPGILTQKNQSSLRVAS